MSEFHLTQGAQMTEREEGFRDGVEAAAIISAEVSQDWADHFGGEFEAMYSLVSRIDARLSGKDKG